MWKKDDSQIENTHVSGTFDDDVEMVSFMEGYLLHYN